MERHIASHAVTSVTCDVGSSPSRHVTPPLRGVTGVTDPCDVTLRRRRILLKEVGLAKRQPRRPQAPRGGYESLAVKVVELDMREVTK